MRETARVWQGFRILFACIGALLSATGRADAQAAPPSGPGQVQVYLVRQDWSDCTNTTVSNAESPAVAGIVSVVRHTDGNTAVKVAMTASSNTTYHVFLKCVRQIGDLATGDEGTGIESFSFPTNLVGNTFAFDIYPEGAPLGNKFQSVQVTVQ